MSGRDSIFSGHRAGCAAHFPLGVCVTLKGLFNSYICFKWVYFHQAVAETLGFLPQKLKAPRGSVLN